MRFTIQDLDKKLAAGTIRGYVVKEVKVNDKTKAVKKRLKKEPEGLVFIMRILDQKGIPYVKEHRFHEVRRFRFDIAILFYKVAIEYDGLALGGATKSRHTTVTGFSGDADKINLAQSEGWRVLRYTALNYKNFESDLKTILCKKNGE